MKAGWVHRDQLLKAERAVAFRTADVLKGLDERWSGEVIDRGEPGTVKLSTEFAGSPGPVLRVGISTLPERLAHALHEHFVQPVREAARRRREAAEVARIDEPAA